MILNQGPESQPSSVTSRVLQPESMGRELYYIFFDIMAERGTCIKRLFWPPYEVKKKSCSSQVSSY